MIFLKKIKWFYYEKDIFFSNSVYKNNLTFQSIFRIGQSAQ